MTDGVTSAAASTRSAMAPVPYRVRSRVVESPDSATLCLEPVGEAVRSPEPGEFMMLYAFGVGEAAISISGDPTVTDGSITHTIRAVGAVSRALHNAEPGSVVGVRGPFGTSWGLAEAAGRDLVMVAGGVGLCPLRPAVLGALAERSRYGKVALIVGARSTGRLRVRRSAREVGRRPPDRPTRHRRRPGPRLAGRSRPGHRAAAPACVRCGPHHRIPVRAGADAALRRRGSVG